MTNDQLSALIAQVQTVSPKLVDPWQATAIVESLGYTDRLIQAEFDFANALEIGRYIYQQQDLILTSPTTNPRQNWKAIAQGEITAFFERFSRSFVYAIPLISLLLLGKIEVSNSWQIIPPQLAALFTLATLASLITSGGFVQAIARRGEFYLGLGLSWQAKRACLALLGWGMVTSFILAVLSLWFGFYRSVFPDEYLIIAAGYYLVLSLLWMLLSMLSLLTIWGTPLSLISLTTLFWLLRLPGGMGALEAQAIAIVVVLLGLSGVILWLFGQRQGSNPTESASTLPNLSATVYLLSPFFAYGISYFCFIFADRLVAGWSVDQASGMIFAIDSAYQRGMDLALVNFLLAVPLSEYLAYKLVNYWYQQAKVISYENMATLSRHLQYRYWLSIAISLWFFALLVTFTIGFPQAQPWAQANLILTWGGCLGYLLLVLGLFNAVILFSLNLASKAIACLFPSLMINLLVGYIAANALSPDWAVLGLIVASLVFLLLSHRQVMQGIAHPDYAYYLGGY